MKQLITGTPVYTLDPRFGVAQAMVTDQGRILAVGELRTLRSDHPDARETAIDGGAIIPAFNDSHAHILLLGQDLTRCNLADCLTRDQVLERLRQWHAEHPLDDWLLAWNFDATNYAGDNPLSSLDLDPAFSRIPVVISDKTKHAVRLNSAAMAMCGISASTPDPNGGIIQRDSTGNPTGVFCEMAAMALVESAMPDPGTSGVELWIRTAMAYLEEKGILAATEAFAGNWYPLESKLAAYNRVLENGGPIRITLLPEFCAADQAGWIDSRPDHLNHLHPDLRIGPLKLMIDGSISALTAALSSPYEQSSTQGHLALTGEELERRVLMAQKAGWATATHAIGDRGIQITLEAIEAAQRTFPHPGLHHRIEHAILLDASLAGRLAAAGIMIAAQPQLLLEMGDNHHAAIGKRSFKEKPYRSLLQAGVCVGFGSDLPVVDGDPILGWRTAVTRQTRAGKVLGHEEALSPLEALACYTNGSARIGGDREIGTLVPGKQARFAVLSHCPEKIAQEDITVTGVSSQILVTEHNHR